MLSLLYCLYYALHEYMNPFSSERRRVAERISYASAVVTCNIVLAAYATKGAGETSLEACIWTSIAVQAVALFLLLLIIASEVLQSQ